MSAPYEFRDLSLFQEEGLGIGVFGVSRITLTTHGEGQRGDKITSHTEILALGVSEGSEVGSWEGRAIKEVGGDIRRSSEALVIPNNVFISDITFQVKKV